MALSHDRIRNSKGQIVVWLSLLMGSALSSGCGGTHDDFPERSGSTPVVEIGTQFKPADCGTVSGVVTWKGTPPVFPVMVVDSAEGPQRVPNPHALVVQPNSDRVSGAVVYLRGIDLARSKPWTLAPGATVEVDDLGITVRDFGRAGFIRHGDSISFVSQSKTAQLVRTRGALNAAVPIPSTTKPSKRIAVKPGRIEMTSGANVACAIAHLFVCEHPYYTTTNSAGEFQFKDVPAGQYELVAWQPNGQVVGHERNPETGLICRYQYGPSFERIAAVTVTAGATTQINVAFP
ncbi:MAG: hypothetical protein U0798_12340 [Gemmataceae bacterium]